MAIALVGQVGTFQSVTWGATNAVATFTVGAGGVAAGDTVIIMLGSQVFGTLSATDSKGNTYSMDQNGGSSRIVGVVSGHITAGLVNSDTITLTNTFSGASGLGMVASAYEFSGIASTSWFDQTSINSSTGSPTTSNSTATTTVANELLIGVFASGSGNSGYSVGTGYTALDNQTGVLGGGIFDTQYQIVSSTGAYAATGILSTTGPTWTQAITTYKAGGGGGGTPTNLFFF